VFSGASPRAPRCPWRSKETGAGDGAAKAKAVAKASGAKTAIPSLDIAD